jgi:hypothetical protein
MRRFSKITLGAGYSEERIASPAILMADIAGPRLSAASVIDSPAAICESQRAYVLLATGQKIDLPATTAAGGKLAVQDCANRESGQ